MIHKKKTCPYTIHHKSHMNALQMNQGLCNEVVVSNHLI